LAGALAHELNNPLQGMCSALSMLSRDCADDPRFLVRVEQIRSGLMRLSQIVDSFSVAFENQPRKPDAFTAADFMDRLISALLERNLRAEVRWNAPHTLFFSCMASELVRLLSAAYSLTAVDSRTILITVQRESDEIYLITERQCSELLSADAWKPLHLCSTFSGLAVLISEMAKLSGGRSEFQFDDLALCGNRLIFACR
jgi:hypothetical protein